MEYWQNINANKSEIKDYRNIHEDMELHDQTECQIQIWNLPNNSAELSTANII